MPRRMAKRLIKNCGPATLYLSDGQVLKPGDSAVVGFDLTMRTDEGESRVTLLEGPDEAIEAERTRRELTKYINSLN